MESPQERRLIVYHARDDAFVPFSRNILAKLGYAILPVEQWRETPGFAVREPELRIVDEARLPEIPRRESAGPVPMILISSGGGVSQHDPRIRGTVCRPAGLHELFRLIQQILEENPRSAPRLPTELEVRCRTADRQWHAAMRSLSESGCLLYTEEPLPLGSQLEICFEIPEVGTVETRADCSYQMSHEAGLVFQQTSPDFRRAIQRFVEQGLL